MSNNTLSSQATGAQASAGFGTETFLPSNWLQDLNIAISAVGPIVALVFVSLRVFVRGQMRTFGWDDVFIILAIVFSVILSLGTVFVVKLNFIGIHFYDVPQGTDPTPGLIWIYVIGAVYNPVLAFVKQSVLLFILRIAGLNLRVRAISWLTSFINMAEMVAVFVVVIFQCSPVESFWDLKLGQQCIDQKSFALSTALLTILTDIIMVALPFWVFLGLQMSDRKKIALILVFSMGLIVTIVSSIRLYILYAMFNTTDPDVNYTIGPSVAIIECNLAIITACAPTLWPLARQWKNLRSTANTYSYPSKCAHCQCGKYHDSGYPSRSSTRYSGSRSHKPAMSHNKSLGTNTVSSVMSSKRGPWEMRRSETSNSSTIMTVSQGLRETHTAEVVLEPMAPTEPAEPAKPADSTEPTSETDIRRSLSKGRSRCTWPDAANPGGYEAGIQLLELTRISDWDGDEDIVLVNMGEGDSERILEHTCGRTEQSKV